MHLTGHQLQHIHEGRTSFTATLEVNRDYTGSSVEVLLSKLVVRGRFQAG